jgi:hypothetical protein
MHCPATNNRARRHLIRPFTFGNLHIELRDEIYEYLLPTNLSDRTLDFNLFDLAVDSATLLRDKSLFLPSPPMTSHALLRACKQTRTGYISRFIALANIRPIMHDLISRGTRTLDSTGSFRHTFCQDPGFRNSPVHVLVLPQDWLVHIKKLTLWLVLPNWGVSAGSAVDWSPLAILSQMPTLNELDLVFKASIPLYQSTPHCNKFAASRDMDAIEKQGGSTYLTGLFIDLLDVILCPRRVALQRPRS